MSIDKEKYVPALRQEGTSRNERFPDSLDPGKILIDDRKLEDFIMYAQRYSRNILFYDTETQDTDIQATWRDFFSNDIAQIAASVATRDTGEIKNSYDRLMNEFKEQKSIEKFSKLVEFVFSLFKRMDEWHSVSFEGSFLRNDLSLNIHSHLIEELRKLKVVGEYISKITGGSDFQYLGGMTDSLFNVDNIWDSEEISKPSLGDRIFKGNSDEDKLANASLVVNDAFESVFYVTKTVTENCRNYFRDFIYRDQNHQPHTALFITFIKLYGFVQDDLNKFSKRTLDYYYRDILKIKPKPAVPDQAVVVLELAKGFDYYEIKKGSLLSAGKDKKNREIFYSTSKEFILNKAKVQSLNTTLIDGGDQGIKGYYAKSLTGEKVDIAESSEIAGSFWRPFGSRQQDLKIPVGTAIASTQFYLSKGQRDITITLVVRNELHFIEYSTDLFKILLTGETGWLDSDIENDGISIQPLKGIKNEKGKDSLELSFSVSITQSSAIIAFDPKIHEGNFTTVKPVMQLLLKFPDKPADNNPGKEKEYLDKIAGLNDLQSVELATSDINIIVGSISDKASFEGVRNLFLENHESTLDNTKPFLPFTPTPKVGSSFYIGSSDLFYKPVQKFSINIEWMVPDNFRTYYQRYFPPYDGNKFMASLDILINKRWKKITDISLIDSRQNNGRFRSIIVELDEKKLSDDSGEKDKNIYKYDVTRKDRTLKLKLLYPDFGHDVYPQLITAAVMEKASSRKGSANFLEIVKQKLNDSRISIKIPEKRDIENMNQPGWANTVFFQNLRLSATKEDQARLSMAEGVYQKFISANKIENSTDKINELYASNTKIVNDDSFLARVIELLKKIKVLDRDIFVDHDKQDVGDVTENLRDRLNRRTNNIMPSERELTTLIISQVNSIISHISMQVTEELLDIKKTAMPNGEQVYDVVKKHVDEANEIINDLIASKIAMLLSASEIPPKPYTPVINSLSISYESNKVLKNNIDQFFHVLPFGVAEIFPLDASKKTGKHLFPSSIIPVKQEAKPTTLGLLFLGLTNAEPGRNISFYFIFNENKKKNDKKPPPVSWFYMSGNNWMPLKDDLLITEGTVGFQKTGIVEIGIPEQMDNRNTTFNEQGLYWLCASIEGDGDVFPNLEEVYTQAVPVVFENNNNNDPAHLALPLEPFKIKHFIEDMPSVKKVMQPVASANGKMMERDAEYYTRVSERLHHKQRAITAWDYERLVLEAFPFIYKVKCINNYNINRFVAGHVTMIPIMNLKNTASDDINLQLPILNYPDLKSIEDYLSGLVSPFIKVHAVNPDINYVLIKARVKFKSGMDRGFHLKVLNDELVKYLTPWAVSNAETVSFSSKVYLSSIIKFIDERSYVEYVTDPEMNQYRVNADGDKEYVLLENNSRVLMETDLKMPQSIIASAPQHQIELV